MIIKGLKILCASCYLYDQTDDLITIILIKTEVNSKTQKIFRHLIPCVRHLILNVRQIDPV